MQNSSASGSTKRFPRAKRVIAIILALLLVLVFVGARMYFVSTRGTALVEQAPAPDFTLTDHRNEKVSLASLLERGPAVVVFYRGFW
jgi:cytochrome oxidase Cu insertion factor (SCO1/SenC/PrrC family)